MSRVERAGVCGYFFGRRTGAQKWLLHWAGNENHGVFESKAQPNRSTPSPENHDERPPILVVFVDWILAVCPGGNGIYSILNGLAITYLDSAKPTATQLYPNPTQSLTPKMGK
jgi:hypothetical protein